MPDNVDYEWLRELLARPERWSANEVDAVTRRRRSQASVLAGLNPRDRRGITSQEALLANIDYALALHTAATRERDRWLAHEREHGYIRARLRLLSTEEGGRRSAIFTGYRSSWTFDRSVHTDQHDAPLLIEDANLLNVGAEGVVRLHPLWPEGWPEVVPGLRLEMREGARVVGRAEVIEVVDPGQAQS